MPHLANNRCARKLSKYESHSWWFLVFLPRLWTQPVTCPWIISPNTRWQVRYIKTFSAFTHRWVLIVTHDEAGHPNAAQKQLLFKLSLPQFTLHVYCQIRNRILCTSIIPLDYTRLFIMLNIICSIPVIHSVTDFTDVCNIRECPKALHTWLT